MSQKCSKNATNWVELRRLAYRCQNQNLPYHPLREALSSPNPLSALIALVKLLYEKLYKVSTENSDLKVQLEEMAFEMRNLKKLPKKPDLKASKLDSPLSDISF